MVIANVEKAIPFQSEWLVYLEIKTNLLHEVMVFNILINK